MEHSSPVGMMKLASTSPVATTNSDDPFAPLKLPKHLASPSDLRDQPFESSSVSSLSTENESWETASQSLDLECVPSDDASRFGKYDWPDGRQYKGAMVNGEKVGLGVFILPNGDRYVGPFEEDQFHGFGTYFCKESKTKYVGEFERNRRCGTGTLYLPSGEWFYGQFENDVIVSGRWFSREGRMLRSREETKETMSRIRARCQQSTSLLSSYRFPTVVVQNSSNHSKAQCAPLAE